MRRRAVKKSLWKRRQITCECPDCGGSGVYNGFMEKRTEAVICLGCEGSGKKVIVIRYKRFTGRKTRDDIKKVLCDSRKRSISYKAFLSGKMPT